jgi:hypothetical protein
MLRKLLCRFLGAELEPNIAWSEIDTMTIVTRMSSDVPGMWGRSETVEQVLCSSGDKFVLFKNWLRSGRLFRAEFGQTLDGREMRLTEWIPEPTPSYRLQLAPRDSDAVVYTASNPTWMRLWYHEGPMNLGAGICFIDSTDRQALKDLRSKLLNGNVPEALQAEEDMWQQINSLPENERRAAMAKLAMQSLGEVNRKFHQMYPDIGPVPDELKPTMDIVAGRIAEIQRTAEATSVDPQLADLMKRFVTDATHRTSSTDVEPQKTE